MSSHLSLGPILALMGAPVWAVPPAQIPGPCYTVTAQGQVLDLAHICNPNIAADRARQQAWEAQIATAVAQGKPLVCQLTLGRVTDATAPVQGRCLGLQATQNLALTVVLAGPSGSRSTQRQHFATVQPGQTYPVRVAFQDYALPPAADLVLSHRLEQDVAPAIAETAPATDVPW